ncbi:hypothetical protein JTE90_003130 [Oedothorax gibbosus]|uniref:Uncharacterized protein n=1 Tax=Oedothorax gibbosus TaxID=931172 RepID=A0AAV6VDB8_9ARAC|nr:hypothetical protein JTE90_003130 [Oedothorax gibbosus]
MLRVVVVIVFAVVAPCTTLPNVIKLGGLFDTNDLEQELAFRVAVNFFNDNRELKSKPRILAQIERIENGDIYDATKKGKINLLNTVNKNLKVI